MSGPAGYQRWRSLLFLHWSIPVEILQPHLPGDLSVDVFQERAWIGIVAFTMRGVRPAWFPALPGLSNFHEINLRTYVRRPGSDPGVWFFSLDAANSVAVLAARAGWSLPYHRATMRLEDRDGKFYYSSRRRWPGLAPADFEARWQVEGLPEPSAPGTLEHFLAERYVLYVKRGKGLSLGRVRHPPYALQQARLVEWKESLLSAAGLPPASGAPHVRFCPGVDVDILGLWPV